MKLLIRLVKKRAETMLLGPELGYGILNSLSYESISWSGIILNKNS